MRDSVGEQGPVGQSGERVVEGQVLELYLLGDPIGHIATAEDQSLGVVTDRRFDVAPTSVGVADPAGHAAARTADA
jgi:hypothetical protein